MGYLQSLMLDENTATQATVVFVVAMYLHSVQSKNTKPNANGSLVQTMINLKHINVRQCVTNEAQFEYYIRVLQYSQCRFTHVASLLHTPS